MLRSSGVIDTGQNGVQFVFVASASTFALRARRRYQAISVLESRKLSTCSTDGLALLRRAGAMALPRIGWRSSLISVP